MNCRYFNRLLISNCKGLSMLTKKKKKKGKKPHTLNSCIASCYIWHLVLDYKLSLSYTTCGGAMEVMDFSVITMKRTLCCVR